MPVRSANSPRIPLFLLVVGVLLTPAVASAQGHPSAGRPRSIHERLDAADRVVRIRVGAVSEGRIAVEEATALVGTATAPFEIKRSPLRPPPLVADDHAIVFLRGARPPYVLVDEPGEVIRLVEAAEGQAGSDERWSDAIQALSAGREETAALAETYLDWIDVGPTSLRALGADGLLDLIERNPSLREGIGAERVVHVVDPAAQIDARRVSAQLAASNPRSGAALCEAVAASDLPLDAALTELTLRACGRSRSEAAITLLERAATHQDVTVRGAAVRSLALIATTAPERTLALAKRLAEKDPDNSVRRAADRMLRNASREKPQKRRAAGH